VNNLVSNAVKYGAGKPVEVRVERAASTARITVIDHGIGIARDDQERNLRTVRATRLRAQRERLRPRALDRPSRSSTRCTATSTVESALGEGSRFTVEIPLRPIPHPAVARA
jgi:light-regulated signal transduction histidine kinase (bacteriophytochrome)